MNQAVFRVHLEELTGVLSTLLGPYILITVIANQLNPLHYLRPYFFKIFYNIILPYVSRSSRSCFPLAFSTRMNATPLDVLHYQIFYCIKIEFLPRFC
jgi:hypothetical protein